MTTLIKTLLASLLVLATFQTAQADSYTEAKGIFENAGESGTFFGKAYGYALFPTIGKGGMGMVYKAFDRMLEEEVAVKVLRRDLTGDPDNARRFRSEIKLARKITHPNVLRTFDLVNTQFCQHLTHGESFVGSVNRG